MIVGSTRCSLSGGAVLPIFLADAVRVADCMPQSMPATVLHIQSCCAGTPMKSSSYSLIQNQQRFFNSSLSRLVSAWDKTPRYDCREHSTDDSLPDPALKLTTRTFSFRNIRCFVRVRSIRWCGKTTYPRKSMP